MGSEAGEFYAAAPTRQANVMLLLSNAKLWSRIQWSHIQPASILGRLDFTWHLHYKGVRNTPAGRPYANKRPPSAYIKTNIPADPMGFNAIAVRAAIELCGVDRVVFGSDFGPAPYGIKEHVQVVEELLLSLANRELVFWKTDNKIFRLGLSETSRITSDADLVAA